VADDRPIAVLAALAANLGIAVAKFVAAAVTGSSSMLAEGIHSVADSGNEVLLLVGRHRAKRPKDDLHPFGHSGEAYFAAFLVAVVLFALGSMFSLFEGYEKFVDPHPVESAAWAIGVLLVAMVLEGLSLRTALRRTARERRSSLLRYVHQTRRPEGAVVLLEDTAAEIGLTAALVGVVATTVTGDGRYDALGTLFIGLLLGVVALLLAREMRSLLVGESGSTAVIEALRGAVESDGGVRQLVDLRTMHLGPDDLLVTARVRLDGTGEDTERAVERLEGALRRAAEPLRSQVWVEPVR
jgi:cation diffusion facilitator family transporter